MNPSMDDIGTAAELAQENFFAFISWDALTSGLNLAVCATPLWPRNL